MGIFRTALASADDEPSFDALVSANRALVRPDDIGKLAQCAGCHRGFRVAPKHKSRLSAMFCSDTCHARARLADKRLRAGQGRRK